MKESKSEAKNKMFFNSENPNICFDILEKLVSILAFKASEQKSKNLLSSCCVPSKVAGETRGFWQVGEMLK